MKVGVLSDTHLQAGQFLPQIVWDSLAGVDLILHAGDSVVPEVLADLNCLAPVIAVKGNCDAWELQHLPERETVDCAGVRLGLTHGYRGRGRSIQERVYQTFARDRVQAIVFGHSHSPCLEWENGVLLFNPGSPTQKRREPYYSLGVIEVNQSEIRARHVFFGEDGQAVVGG
ncbi:hypothetical protein CEB3_c24220 [Peptococcaceae bacterium CEB3]|nr:hypothetical protein CEB3_c24220 [Peptococcaceae bacterium CEB3]